MMSEGSLSKPDKDGFKRSSTNKGALVNTDQSALEGYKALKKRMSRLDKVDELENRISSLEGTCNELLRLMNVLVHRKD